MSCRNDTKEDVFVHQVSGFCEDGSFLCLELMHTGLLWSTSLIGLTLIDGAVSMLCLSKKSYFSKIKEVFLKTIDSHYHRPQQHIQLLPSTPIARANIANGGKRCKIAGALTSFY